MEETTVSLEHNSCCDLVNSRETSITITADRCEVLPLCDDRISDDCKYPCDDITPPLKPCCASIKTVPSILPLHTDSHTTHITVVTDEPKCQRACNCHWNTSISTYGSSNCCPLHISEYPTFNFIIGALKSLISNCAQTCISQILSKCFHTESYECATDCKGGLRDNGCCYCWNLGLFTTSRCCDTSAACYDPYGTPALSDFLCFWSDDCTPAQILNRVNTDFVQSRMYFLGDLYPDLNIPVCVMNEIISFEMGTGCDKIKERFQRWVKLETSKLYSIPYILGSIEMCLLIICFALQMLINLDQSYHIPYGNAVRLTIFRILTRYIPTLLLTLVSLHMIGCIVIYSICVTRAHKLAKFKSALVAYTDYNENDVQPWEVFIAVQRWLNLSHLVRTDKFNRTPTLVVFILHKYLAVAGLAIHWLLLSRFEHVIMADTRALNSTSFLAQLFVVCFVVWLHLWFWNSILIENMSVKGALWHIFRRFAATFLIIAVILCAVILIDYIRTNDADMGLVISLCDWLDKRQYSVDRVIMAVIFIISCACITRKQYNYVRNNHLGAKYHYWTTQAILSLIVAFVIRYLLIYGVNHIIFGAIMETISLVFMLLMFYQIYISSQTLWHRALTAADGLDRDTYVQTFMTGTNWIYHNYVGAWLGQIAPHFK